MIILTAIVFLALGLAAGAFLYHCVREDLRDDDYTRGFDAGLVEGQRRMRAGMKARAEAQAYFARRYPLGSTARAIRE